MKHRHDCFRISMEYSVYQLIGMNDIACPPSAAIVISRESAAVTVRLSMR